MKTKESVAGSKWRLIISLSLSQNRTVDVADVIFFEHGSWNLMESILLGLIPWRPIKSNLTQGTLEDFHEAMGICMIMDRWPMPFPPTENHEVKLPIPFIN